MNILQGIKLPELIMLVLGFILGLTLIFIFLYTALRSKPNLNILYGFIVPAGLIGYPSYQSSKFTDKVDQINTLVTKVNTNPTDTAAQRQLVNELRALPASRCKTSVDAMTTIANAQASLGLYDLAEKSINQAIAINDKSKNAQESKRTIEKQRVAQQEFEGRITLLEKWLKEWQADPRRRAIKDSITTLYNQLNGTVHLDKHQVLVVAEAAEAIGQKETAEQFTNDVLTVSPNDQEAVKIRNKLRTPSTTNQRPKPSTKINERVRETTTKPQATVPAPAPVYQDTLTIKNRFRIIPKSSMEVNRWWDKTN